MENAPAQINEEELNRLMRDLSRLNRDPRDVYSREVLDGIYGGLKQYGGGRSNPFLATGLPQGLLEVEASPSDKQATAKVTRQDEVGPGVVTTQVSKGINNPEELARILYQQQLGGGQLAAQATYGRSAMDNQVRMLEIEYLKQIMKNLGFGGYYSASPQGQTAGLRLQGRF